MKASQWVRRHSLELQFWFYESGNVIASVTGAGGIVAFGESLLEAQRAQSGSLIGMLHWLAVEFPEAFATIGVMLLIIAAHPVAHIAGKLRGASAAAAVNVCAVPFALLLLGYAVWAEANMFTIAACAFVLGSCFLRGAGTFPILLKLGGVLLSAGGVALAIAGAMEISGGVFERQGALGAATFLTGFFVAGAGLLTYRGGTFAVAASREAGVTQTNGLLGIDGVLIAKPLERWVDPCIERITDQVVLPSLFWVPTRTKLEMPFRTSMLARLPWRVLTGMLALATGTPAGTSFAIANLLWSLGDIAIGALDGADEVAVSETTAI